MFDEGGTLCEVFGGTIAPVDGEVACIGSDGSRWILGILGIDGNRFWLNTSREVEVTVIVCYIPNGDEGFGGATAIASADIIFADALAIVCTFGGTLIIDKTVAESCGTATVMRFFAIDALIFCGFIDI